MRHRKHSNSLGLTTGHRRAVLANLATALLTHGRIETTQAKARAVRPYVEKLITLGKKGDLHSRRQALSKLSHKSGREIVDRLFNDVAPAFAARNGGYTRIIKTRFRVGDAAPMAIIELVGEAASATETVEPKAEAKKAAPKKAKAETKEEAKEVEANEAEPKAEAKKAAPKKAKAEAKEAEPKAEAKKAAPKKAKAEEKKPEADEAAAEE